MRCLLYEHGVARGRRRDAETSPMSEPLLRHRGPDPALQGRRRLRRGRRLHAVDDVDLTIGQRRDRRAGRRERQRQEHHRPAAGARLQADARARSASRGEPLSRLRSRRDRLAYRGDVPDGVPGPVQLAQPRVPGLARHPARAQAAPAATSPRGSGAPRRSGCSRRSASTRPATMLRAVPATS